MFSDARVPKKISRYVKFDKIDRNGDGEIDAFEAGQIDSLVEGARERIHLRRNDQGEVKLLNDAELLGNWTVRMREEGSEVQKVKHLAELFMTRYEGVLQGNLVSRQDMASLFCRLFLNACLSPLILVFLPLL